MINSIFAGAMITIMALCVFGGLLPLGSVNAELAFPAVLLASILGILWSLRMLFGANPQWSYSPIHWPVFAFATYAFVRYWFSPLEYEARIELFTIAVCAVVYFVCANQFHLARDRAIIIAVLVCLALFQSGYGIWQALTKSDAVLQWVRPEGYRGRGSGTLICPNHLAGMLEMILGLVIARAVIVRRECQSLERATIVKILIIYAAVMIVLGILFTFSRAGWTATIVGLLVFAVVGDWRPRFSWPRIAVVGVVLGIVSIAAWNITPVRVYILKSLRTDERTQTVSLSDPTIGGRTMMWKDTIRMIRDEPLFGYGGGSWQWIYQQYKNPKLLSRPDYSHNDYLNLASDYGIVGFLLMGAVVVAFFRHAWTASRPPLPPEHRAFAAGAMISVTAILFHSWFDSSLHIPGNAILLAVILGCTAALGDPQRYPRRQMNPMIRTAAAGVVILVCTAGLWFFVPTARAARYTDLGNLLKTELDYELALAYYDYAIWLDPRFPEPHAKRGDVHRTWAYWRLGEEKLAERKKMAREAIASYETSLGLNPYQAFVLLDKAKMHEILGEVEEATRTYERAVEVYPSNPMAYFLMGTFFRDRGNPDRARTAFEKAIQLHYTPAIGMNLDELRSPQQ